jgi:hypothetical protein
VSPHGFWIISHGSNVSIDTRPLIVRLSHIGVARPSDSPVVADVVTYGVDSMPTKQALTVIGFLAVTCLFSIANDGGAPSAPASEQIIRQAELLAGDGQPYSFFGASVAVSGNTAVVGAPGYNDDFGNYVPGYAYVFVKPASGWVNMVQTAELKASDSGNAAGNFFGQSVAIAGDTIVVGCEGLSQAYVYMKPAGGWVNMTESAILSPGSPTFSGFGYAVTMDGAADTIVVGAYGTYINDIPKGAGYVYLRPPGGWQTTSVVNAVLTASDGQQNDHLGVSVAIAGNTIVLGASGKPYPFAPGAVYVYVKPETGWASMTQNAELTASVKVSGANLGSSVGIVGNTIAAGAPGGSESQPAGNVFVYVEPAGGWGNMTETARVTDGNTVVDGLGWSVGLTGAGLVAGAPFDTVDGNQQAGSVYVFLKPKAGWKSTSKYTTRLTATYGEDYDILGISVAVASDMVVAGAPQAYGLDDVGLGYVFFTDQK